MSNPGIGNKRRDLEIKTARIPVWSELSEHRQEGLVSVTGDQTVQKMVGHGKDIKFWS